MNNKIKTSDEYDAHILYANKMINTIYQADIDPDIIERNRYIQTIPCRIGTILYKLEMNMYTSRQPSIVEYKVIAIEMHEYDKAMIRCEALDENHTVEHKRWFPITDIGNRLFHTPEEVKNQYDKFINEHKGVIKR